jgi:nucleoside-diphosphate-sugar epimerase
MLASAFLSRQPELEATIFARGVADSTSVDRAAYARELTTLEDALDAAATAGHPLVYFSSAPVYGRFNGHAMLESDEPAPVTPYGRHKLACEELVRSSPGSTLVLRLPNVVGPGGNPNQLIPSLVRQVLAGRVTILAAAARDLLDVDDVVTLTTRLVAADAPRRLADGDRTVNVASGICTPVTDIVAEIAAILGRDPLVELVDGGEAQHFSIARLRGLAGAVAVGPRYVAMTLARHVPVIAEALEPAVVGATTSTVR